MSRRGGRPLLTPPVLLVGLLLSGCAAATPVPSAATPEPVPTRARVDSALCDDLRRVVTVRQGAVGPGTDVEREAAESTVAATSARVLSELGGSSGVPPEVLAALQELADRAAPDQARDALVAGYVTEQCG